jgi:magnesium-transporting ATPase (P-type)
MQRCAPRGFKTAFAHNLSAVARGPSAYQDTLKVLPTKKPLSDWSTSLGGCSTSYCIITALYVLVVQALLQHFVAILLFSDYLLFITLLPPIIPCVLRHG